MVSESDSGVVLLFSGRASRTRVIRTAAVGAAAVLALSGCNGASNNATALEALTPVAAIQRVADNASSDSAAYTFEMLGSGIKISGSGSYRGGEHPAAAMAFDEMKVLGASIPGGTEFRLVDDVMYLRFAGGGLIPAIDGGTWVKLPMDEVKAEGSSIAGLDPTMADPREQLKRMLDTDEVRKVGTETIDGVDTTHYSASVTPSETGTVTEKRSESSTELSRELEDKLANSIRESMGIDKPVDVDVWVDGEYRARKMVMHLPFMGEATVTMKFKDFGSDVKVEAPAGAEVLNLGDMLGGVLGGGLGGSFGDLFGGKLGDSGSLSEDLSQQFEDKFRKQIEDGLFGGLGGSFSDSDLDGLIRNS